MTIDMKKPRQTTFARTTVVEDTNVAPQAIANKTSTLPQRRHLKHLFLKLLTCLDGIVPQFCCLGKNKR
jgi:hypothetical protein